MDINTPRGRSVSLSFNNSRELLICSNLSSIPYHKRIEDISNKLSWNKQVVLNKKEDFTLSYTISKIGDNNLANKTTDYNYKKRKQYSNIEVTTLNNMPISQGECMINNNTNTYTLQGLKTLSIQYKDYKLAKLNS